MKKVFKLFIICFVFTTLFFAKGNTVSAASIREGDITWEIKNQVLYIKPASGTKGVMKDYKLTSKKPWSGKDFNTIRIEKGVKEVGEYAFANTKAKRIEIMEGVEIINEGAFYGSKNLQYLRLPDKCVYIGHKAFANSSTKETDFVMDYLSKQMIQTGGDIFEGILDSNTLRVNITRVAHMINFQYDYEHMKLYNAAQFNVIEKTPINEVSGPYFTYEYYTGKPITFKLSLWSELLQLSEGIHYTGKFTNNINPGKATITYTGIGQFFTGTKTLTFEIRLPEIYDLKGSSLSSDSIELKWSKNAVVDGYEIQRYDSKSKSYKTIATLKNSITNYKDTGLNSKTAYSYRIRTYKVINGKKNYSLFRDAVKITTKDNTTVSKVSNFKISSKTSSSIKLSWKKSSNVTGYEIQRYDSKSKSYKTIAILKNTINSYNNTKLNPGYTYKYRIRAYKTINGKKYYSSYSSTISGTTLPRTPSVKLSTSNKSIKVSWTKLSESNGYEVYYSTSKNGKYTLLKNFTKNSYTSYTKTKLTKNKTYYFKVRSYDLVNNNKIYSNYSSVKYIKVK